MMDDRYISQNALITEIAKIRGNLNTRNVGQAIWDTPTADVVEVVKGCEYCLPNETGHGKIKYSYDDTDGMIMVIHPSPLRKDGTRSLSWWATVNFRGEQRDFLIECCPFCGKRLVPKREDIGETPYGN